MSNELAEGAPAPEFKLPVSVDRWADLSGYKGKKLVIFFYPKDDTSGCTKESIGFSESLGAFAEADTEILGISADSLRSHAKFTDKHGLQVALASDEDKQAIAAYGVWVEKSMYGRKYMGIERSTFLIDRDGNIAHIWRKVKVPGHVDAVLEAAQALA